ncbi:MAG TPA: terminase small subunit [Prolixibacteraceae bacterium]|nr:terminase small subunit [Prolixibacteraceae bacterium]
MINNIENINESVALNKLTKKEQVFCYEYLANGFNATRASIKAGYAENSATVTGSRLLRKANIKSKIEQLQKNLSETAGISSLMIAKEHAKIAFSNVAKLHNTWIERKELESLSEDEKSCIQEVSTKVIRINSGTKDEPIPADVEYVKIKTYDKQKSLDALSSLLGFNAPSKTEITGKDGEQLQQSIIILPAKKTNE